MRWIRTLTPDLDDSADVLGAKARGLTELQRLGLPVPPGFVITTEACRAYLRDGHFPDRLREELIAAIGDLETRAGRRFGGLPALAVSVRSGASVSMPGMMSTILDLGLTSHATEHLATETGDARFALDSRLRFLTTFASALTGTDIEPLRHGAVVGAHAADDEPARLRAAIAAAETAIERRHGTPVPDDAFEQLLLAVEGIFSSWNTPRAQTYRELHGIDDDLGTAVVVQAMVFGNRDDHSGTGVAFSRDPNTGDNVPFGDVLFARQGEDVVAGRVRTLPLHSLEEREPAVWAALLDALHRIEDHFRDAVYVEFTYQAGQLWLLQTRPGRFTGAAAVRLAVDLADAQAITRAEAVLRVSSRHLDQARVPRIAQSGPVDVVARGVGASPGVSVGAIATTTDAALRMAAEGDVILVRPETSPHDMSGLAAATGIVTARGGAASHAAVVARSMGKPAVVGILDLTIDDRHGTITAAGRTLDEGAILTIDGTSGQVALGHARVDTGAKDPYVDRLLSWADDISGDRFDRDDTGRLRAAHATLRSDQPG